VSKVIPFEALIPRAELAGRVICPPYDVISSEEARMMAAGNPHSLLHVTKPEIDLPEGTAEGDGRIYAKGAENLARLQADGTLGRDARSFYVYRMEKGGHAQTGIVAAVAASEYERGLIKRHERTREPKVVDRTRLALALRAHAEPVLLVCRGSAALSGIIAREVRSRPLYDLVDSYGVRNVLWRASRPDEIMAAFDAMDALYIADGHHRSETAFRTMREMRDGDPGHRGDEAYGFFPAVIVPEEDVRIYRYDWDGPPAERPLADVSISDVMKLADEGGIMPPKSTWFAPKLASGLFVYTF
jgi:uncharacterized protein (DUF1015 family)